MPKRRGRPAELSRIDIVEAALGLLEEGGPASVTMARVAEAVGASPMGLYRHVAGREELLGSMLDQLMSQLDIELPPDAPWQANVRTWMKHVRAHFLAHPQMLALIDFEPGHHLSPTWLSVVGKMIQPLQAAEMEGQQIARGILLVSRLTLGTVVQEVVAPVSDTAAVVGGLGHLDDEDALQWIDVLPELKRVDDDAFFELVQEQVIGAIESWVE